MSSAATSKLRESQADELFALYRDYIKVNGESDARFLKFLLDSFPSVEKCKYAWQKLNVDFSTAKIKEILQNEKVLQLRAIDPECRTLIVGCGNGPFACAGGYPIGTLGDDSGYVLAHAHVGAITINPLLAANPTLVGFFGVQEFPMLQNGQFDLIVIEGIQIEDTEIGRSELVRIASKTAKIVCTHGGLQGLEFSWEDNHKCVWSDDYVPPPVVINLTDHPCFSRKK